MNKNIKKAISNLSLLIFLIIIIAWYYNGSTKTPAPRAAAPSLYSQADVPINHAELIPYAAQLPAAMNKVREIDHYCKQNMDPTSIVIDEPRSKKYYKTTFIVRCWTNEGNHNKTYFDIAGKLLP